MGGSGTPAAADEMLKLTKGVLLLRREGSGGREEGLAFCRTKGWFGRSASQRRFSWSKEKDVSYYWTNVFYILLEVSQWPALLSPPSETARSTLSSGLQSSKGSLNTASEDSGFKNGLDPVCESEKLKVTVRVVSGLPPVMVPAVAVEQPSG